MCIRDRDYGYHAPTLSFPVHGTLMIEPTESESLGQNVKARVDLQAVDGLDRTHAVRDDGGGRAHGQACLLYTSSCV